MNADLHPITKRVVAAALERADPAMGLAVDELKTVANLVLDSADGEHIALQMIALAKRMGGEGPFAEQLVVLAGLALGDAAGAAIHKTTEAPKPTNALAYPSTEAPKGSAKGGPLLRSTLDPESKCPMHRIARNVKRKLAL